ncbi:MAG TPA: VCBS repeat-containing protein [Planctomycetota bacterium]|nr:VCBS repeat-containing protein [Planctomycetota bacterium]
MALIRVVLISCSLGLVLAASPSAQLVFGPSQLGSFAPGELEVRAGAGDVDGDGLADVVSIAGGAPSLHLGDGLGHFGPGAPVAGNASGEDLCLADLDGDGLADLMVVSAAQKELHVLLADGAGGFDPEVSFALGSSSAARTVVARDVDADGDPDVVTVGQNDIRVFLNDGAGGVTPGPIKVDFSAGFPFIDAHPASLNGDAWPDLIIAKGVQSDPRSDIYFGQPGGGWAFQAHMGDAAVRALGDLDGDGDLDLIETSHHPLQSVIVRSHLNDGDGTFAAGPQTDLQFLVGFGSDLDLQDLDADGRADLVVVNSDDFNPPGPEAWLLHGDGTGAFTMRGARVTLASTSTTTQAWVGPCADFDADGRLDVSALVAPGGETRLAVMLNRTYPDGGPLLDLGGQLSSTATGYPIQIAAGSFAGGTPFSFALHDGPSSGLVTFVVGFSVLQAPFKGGTMVPTPQALFGPFPTTPSGTLTLAGTWPPALPSGFQLAAQFWFTAPAVAGFAASSGVLVTTP